VGVTAQNYSMGELCQLSGAILILQKSNPSIVKDGTIKKYFDRISAGMEEPD
jgi:hypothetical protein